MELKSRKSSDFSQEMKFEINNLETEIKEFESKLELFRFVVFDLIFTGVL